MAALLGLGADLHGERGALAAVLGEAHGHQLLHNLRAGLQRLLCHRSGCGRGRCLRMRPDQEPCMRPAPGGCLTEVPGVCPGHHARAKAQAWRLSFSAMARPCSRAAGVQRPLAAALGCLPGGRSPHLGCRLRLQCLARLHARAAQVLQVEPVGHLDVRL